MATCFLKFNLFLFPFLCVFVLTQVNVAHEEARFGRQNNFFFQPE